MKQSSGKQRTIMMRVEHAGAGLLKKIHRARLCINTQFFIAAGDTDTTQLWLYCIYSTVSQSRADPSPRHHLKLACTAAIKGSRLYAHSSHIRRNDILTSLIWDSHPSASRPSLFVFTASRIVYPYVSRLEERKDSPKPLPLPKPTKPRLERLMTRP